MGENEEKEEEWGGERVLVNKPQASSPTADEWGRGGSPARGDRHSTHV